MSSKLFSLFFIQAMMFFNPLNTMHDQHSNKDRHTHREANTSFNFPIGLYLSLLKRKSSENKMATDVSTTPEKDSGKVKEEINLELTLGCGTQKLPDGMNGARAVKSSHIKTPAIKKTVTHKKAMTRQGLVVSDCKGCRVDNMTGKLRVCPRCQALNSPDVKTAGGVKNDEIKPKMESLVLMGCKSCISYFMEVKSNPICPFCKKVVPPLVYKDV